MSGLRTGLNKPGRGRPVSRSTPATSAPASKYSWFQFQEAAGASTAVDSAPSAQQIFGDVAIPGTTTNVFDTPGQFTAEAVAGHEFKTTDSGVLADLRLDTLTNGGILFSLSFFASSQPSATEAFFGYGRSAADSGGYFLNMQSTGKVSLSVYDDAAGIVTTRTTDADLADSVFHNVVVYLDVTNLVGTLWIDGVLENSNDIQLLGDLASEASTRGAQIWCKATSGAAYAQQLGTKGSGSQINDLFVMRSESDIADIVPIVAQQWADSPRTLPIILDGR